ncbi:sulfite exporter TauE/SafE family protein [Dyadobacter fanqingshengii]|uniref:Probable membrane transporter protein n=1 Tax=Dyadobacter fanqingshengii TaxID=2906443 RepID=A0A9X1PB53_9BACT|nr:sulfite exporter TauE/SafE family protein [Dyadobacter fanqingshengii]MCF0040230.1 sulfite exporter TauE/SafE family protein [Dyadobacter fanqingshengii]MCF2502284.1 sulfite exporter TauE/SafE family protein [Dyadobacter fanqingshengii]USJ38022.1 sulfite exporter TauE/SafE family protein [Dyadobacter fanqingshengii]
MLTKVLSLKLPTISGWYFIPAIIVILLSTLFLVHGSLSVSQEDVNAFIGSDFALYLLVGLAAQLVDGALGMAYGVTSTSFLLSLGVPPAISSTSVHVAEMFTTGASAISHFRYKNINKKLFKSLLIPGVLGAITGAYLLSDVIDGDFVKPYIAAYMLILGLIIIRKALQKNLVKNKTKKIGILAAAGGFLDSIGGGGWGPIVTSTLLGQGRDPRYTIGSVNAAEFVIAFASGVTFLIFTGVSSWQVVSGLIIGGVIAAPFGAMLVGKIKRKPLMLIIGVLVIGLSARTIWLSF